MTITAVGAPAPRFGPIHILPYPYPMQPALPGDDDTMPQTDERHPRHGGNTGIVPPWLTKLMDEHGPSLN